MPQGSRSEAETDPPEADSQGAEDINALGRTWNGLYVHHTDGDRESAYDRKSHVGTLDKALDMAADNDWIIIDMKQDWKTIFPPEK